MRRRLPLLLCALGLQLAACSDRSSTAAADGEETPTKRASFALALVDMDAAAASKGPRPFIAGEATRVTVRLEGGQPPYELRLDSAELGLDSQAVQIGTAQQGSEAIESGVELVLPRAAKSGSYQLRARAVDAEGRASEILGEAFELVGEGAPVRSEASKPWPLPHLELFDAGKRQRRLLYRGELLELVVHMREPGPLAVALSRPVAHIDDLPARSYQSTSTEFRMPLPIPRLAQSGDYFVEVATAKGQERLAFQIAGPAYGPRNSLGLAELSLRGGPDGRSPRAGILQRSEALHIEAVVSGIAEASEIRIRMRNRKGELQHDHALEPLRPASPTPMGRYLLTREWTVPADLPVGRYVFELELAEADDVATVYREVLVQ